MPYISAARRILVIAALAAFSEAYTRQPRRRSAGYITTQTQSNSSNFALGPGIDWTSTTSENVSLSFISLERRDSISHTTLRLKRNKKDTLWVGPVQIGTPRPHRDSRIQSLDILFSTGSDVSWVGSCAGFNHIYVPIDSYTSQFVEKPFYVDQDDKKQGLNEPPRAHTYKDVVDVAGLKPEMEFGVVTNARRLEADAYDGVFSLSQFKHLSTELRHQNFLASNDMPKVFAFNMHENGAEIRFGANIPGIEYHPVKKLSVSPHLWAMDVTGKLVIGKSVVIGNVNAYFHSGTPMIYGPRTEVSLIYEHVGIKPQGPNLAGYYTFPCNDEFTDDIYISWNNEKSFWPVLRKHFVYTRDGEICTGIFRAHPFSSSNWILGQAFNKDKLIEFDDEQNRIGLKEAIRLGT